MPCSKSADASRTRRGDRTHRQRRGGDPGRPRLAAADCPAPADALDRFLRVYNSRLLRFTRPYDGIPDLLQALEARGTLAVLTNKPLGATRRILDGLELSSFFGDRASAEMVRSLASLTPADFSS